MLKKIRIKNLYSFRDEVEFSMEATRIKEYDKDNCFYSKKNKMLKIASIHGLNGAGKSNLIKAIFNLKKMIVSSHMLGSECLKEFENFKFLINSDEIPSEIEISFVINNIDYCYSIKMLKGKIINEFLSKKVSKEIVIFNRTDSSWKNLNMATKYLTPEKMSFIPKELKTDKTLVLTVLGTMGENSQDVFFEIKNYFENNFFIINGMHENMGKKITHEFLDKDNLNRNKILNIMKKYSIGMDDFLYQSTEEIIPFEDLKKNPNFPKEILEKIEKKLKLESSTMEISRKDVEISTVHKVYNQQNEVVDEAILDFEKYTSEGTKVLYNIAGAIFEVLETGGVLIMDEGLGLLHTIALEDILKLFNSEVTNLNNSQLIITGQNPYIMSDGNLRRDQIMIVTKNNYSGSLIERLSDYKSIKSTNSFSKNYLNILRKTLKN